MCTTDPLNKGSLRLTNEWSSSSCLAHQIQVAVIDDDPQAQVLDLMESNASLVYNAQKLGQALDDAHREIARYGFVGPKRIKERQ